MHTLEVSTSVPHLFDLITLFPFAALFVLQVEFHIAMPTLVLVLDPSTWMMSLVLQVLVSFWSALAGQS